MPKRLVLVVEDETFTRLNIVGQLEDMGFTVLEAENADAAIEILEQRDDIRLVFTDVEMPGTMDGIQLARFVRERWPPTAIVICYKAAAARRTTLSTYWLSKPFNEDTMAQAVKAAKGWLIPTQE